MKGKLFRTSLHSYTLTPDGMSAANNVGVFFAASAKKKPPFTWDEAQEWVFAKVKDGIIEKGIVGAAAGKIIDRILGPDDWQRDVTDQLKNIVEKLDDILREVRALKNFIRENEIANWKSILETRLAGRINILTRTIKSAQMERKLSEQLKGTLNQNMNELEIALEDLSLLKEPETNHQLAIPFFPAIQAGLTMLLIAHRIAGEPRSRSALVAEAYAKRFNEWSALLEQNLLKQMYQSNSAEAEFLNSFPKKGFVGPYGVGHIVAPTDTRRIDVFAVINGSADEDFSFVRFEDGPVLDKNEHSYHTRKIPVFMFPHPFVNEYFFYNNEALPGGNLGPGHVQITTWPLDRVARSIETRDCSIMNARREALRRSIEETHACQLFRDSITAGAARFKEISNAR